MTVNKSITKEILLANFKLNYKLIIDRMLGKNIEVYYPEVSIVEYSSSIKYSTNFCTRVLAAALA